MRGGWLLAAVLIATGCASSGEPEVLSEELTGATPTSAATVPPDVGGEDTNPADDPSEAASATAAPTEAAAPAESYADMPDATRNAVDVVCNDAATHADRPVGGAPLTPAPSDLTGMMLMSGEAGETLGAFGPAYTEATEEARQTSIDGSNVAWVPTEDFIAVLNDLRDACTSIGWTG